MLSFIFDVLLTILSIIFFCIIGIFGIIITISAFVLLIFGAILGLPFYLFFALISVLCDSIDKK